MIFKTEQELATFAENLGKTLKPPFIFELVGDVGAGKTTFTRHLAKGLGVKAPVTSPSFTISNRYSFKNGTLVHYDFYRLSEPGLMRDELREVLNASNAIIVLEWAESVADLLPKDHTTITFKVREDGSRELNITGDKNNPKLVQSFPEQQAPSKKTDWQNLHPTNQVTDQALNLYLDTSNFTAKIKLEDPETGEIIEFEDDLGHEMAEKLLKTLENHLKEHNKSWHDLGQITFYSGPGSFTGLRIGATIVNTLAHELNIPLYDHKGIKHQIILPDYGRPANISTPKK